MAKVAVTTPLLIPATKIGRKSIRFFTPTAERKEGVFLTETPLYISSFLLYILGLISWVLFI
jgi:hypothetical protein